MPNPYILVVDDDEDFCNLVATVLRRAGAYMVETAADGQEALRLLLDGDRVPDVIVTDFQMPKMSGGDLIAHLRRNPKFARVPIAVLSGMAQAVAGADYVLQKPIATDALISRVKHMCAAAKEVLGATGPCVDEPAVWVVLPPRG